MINGEPPSGYIGQNWKVPEPRVIEDFFGVSGSFWTPAQWKALAGGKSVSHHISSSSSPRKGLTTK